MPSVSIEGKTCFYQDRGEGHPILLGHSYLWTSEIWEPQLEELSKEYRCIAVDLWDHGKSGRLNAENYTIEQLAKDYWNLMQTLEIPEFSIIGLSVGGMWGTQLALDHPQAVSSLTIMDTFVGSEPMMSRLKYFGMLNMIEKEKGFSEALLDQVVPLFFSPHTLTHKPDLVSAFRKKLSEIPAENIPGIVTLGNGIFSRASLLGRLSEINQPALVITGQDDIPRPPSEAKQMADRLPNGELHLIENAGHICNMEQPDPVNLILKEFLSKVSIVKAI